MNSPAAALDASYAYCRAATRRHARSFYFASIALPREKRRAAFAVYAFCRYADDLVDRAISPEDARQTLALLGTQLDQLMLGQDESLPFAPAFAWAVQRYGLEKEHLLILLAGVGRDLGPVRIRDWPELRAYCYEVASVVGLIMARIFELRDEAARDRAVELGLAMQLTNIVRDVSEDYRLGRIYLPADEMSASAVTAADLSVKHVNARTRALLQAQIARAREYYRRAEAGIPRLADDGSQLTVWIMRHVYAGIADEIEHHDYQVLARRVSVSTGRKVLLAMRAWRDYRRTR